MSLVAYDSSGEESEGEDDVKDERRIAPTAGPKQQLKDEGNAFKNVDELTNAIKESKQNKSNAKIEAEDIDEGISKGQGERKPSKSLFSFLPPPSKKETEDFAIEDKDDIVLKHASRYEAKKEDLGATVGKKQPDSKSSEQNGVRKIGKLNLPKPRKIGEEGEKQKVKIAIPNLPTGDSDSDEEENKMAKRRILGKSASGLLQSLPQPKFSSTVTKNADLKPNERKPSKLYVPYTLTKKKDEPKNNDKKVNEKENESDSDDEGPSSSFFSFGNTVNEPKKGSNASETTSLELKSVLTGKNIESKIELVKSAPVVESRTKSDLVIKKTINTDKLDSKVNDIARTKDRISGETTSSAITGPYESSVTGPYGANVQQTYGKSTGISNNLVTGPYGTYDATYSGSFTGTYSSSHSGSYGGAYGSYGGTSYGGTDSYYQGNMANQHGQRAYLNPEPDSQYGQSNQYASGFAEEKQSIDSDQLRRLQGKRERMVQEIDIIDIHGEKMHCDSSTLLKNITEEKTHVPKRSKSDLPSSQQKRKHQITYLAFQAKERENELRKSWAANHQTKRQTQQKYGF